jgi:putative inorganic carbon (hco3(-)) transporter
MHAVVRIDWYKLMNDSHMSLSETKVSSHAADTEEQSVSRSMSTVPPSHSNGTEIEEKSFFWWNRLIECSLVLSMMLYYLIGNHNVKFLIGNMAQWNPLFGIPFLIVFAVLCWYRLPFAVGLFPLALPYYLAPKDVIQSAVFSPAEIVLWLSVVVACAQFLLYRRKWQYRLSLQDVQRRLGPFLWPILVFVLAALISTFVASSRDAALRAFREEILDPLVYVGLIFFCLRSRQDLSRLLAALFATGLVIALMSIIQYQMFGLNQTYAVYGSPPSVGLLFDYTLPVGLALVFSRISWKVRLAVVLLCIPFVYALLNNNSRGASLAAFPLVLLFVIALSVRKRKVLLVSGVVVLILAAGGYGVFHNKVNHIVENTIINGHSDKNDVSTLDRRVYLWQSAVAMIHDQPWFGYGLDNWLCHYADPRVVVTADAQYRPNDPTFSWMQSCPMASHYYIVGEVNGKITHMYDQPELSHPHNIFLHVWVSIGIFGLLAFVTFLILFFWLFATILRYLTQQQSGDVEQWRWIVVATAACMLAAIIQGMVDSAFLAQDLSFCFWLLVALLLVTRSKIGMSWQVLLPAKRRRV